MFPSLFFKAPNFMGSPHVFFDEGGWMKAMKYVTTAAIGVPSLDVMMDAMDLMSRRVQKKPLHP